MIEKQTGPAAEGLAVRVGHDLFGVVVREEVVPPLSVGFGGQAEPRLDDR